MYTRFSGSDLVLELLKVLIISVAHLGLSPRIEVNVVVPVIASVDWLTVMQGHVSTHQGLVKVCVEVLLSVLVQGSIVEFVRAAILH